MLVMFLWILLIFVCLVTQEQVLKLFDDYRDISNRMMPIDKRQFNQLMEKVGKRSRCVFSVVL